jgi:tetratricopeptide (TPR) repeat protein
MLRFKESEEYIQRIEKISPKNKDVTLIKGQLALARDGDYDKAISEFLINKEGSGAHAWNYWNALLYSGQLDRALDFAKTSKQFVSSGFSYNSNDFMTGLTYFLKKNKADTKLFLDKSINILLQKLDKDSENKNYLVALCNANAALGNLEKANSFCQRALQISHDAYDYPFDIFTIAEAYSMLNEKQHALSLLKKLLTSEVRPSENILRLSPFLKNLHSEPEFEILLKRIGSGELVADGDTQ